MKTLWFVVPVHGRLELAKICLRQLKRTCDALAEGDVKATAVVISDRLSLKVLKVDKLGFASIRRDNAYTSRRFNDGIQLATDPKYNKVPADYVVPFGSDDWADHRLFLEPLPAADTIFGFKHMSCVREDGAEIAEVFLDYEGGCGIRIIPRELVVPLDYRPADEDRERGCDTSILRNLRHHHGDRLKVRDGWQLHGRQIVDWKTQGRNLNGYQGLIMTYPTTLASDPFGELQEFYPAEALDEMRSHYARQKVRV